MTLDLGSFIILSLTDVRRKKFNVKCELSSFHFNFSHIFRLKRERYIDQDACKSKYGNYILSII